MIECSICYNELSTFRSLSNFPCTICIEKGDQLKYVCKSCLKKWPDSCPFCRQELDHTLKVDTIRTPTGKNLEIIIKQKQCCCLKIKKCFNKNMDIIGKLPDCFTIYSWCQAITKVLLLHISFGFLAFVFIFGICNNHNDGGLCWICILCGALNTIGSWILMYLLFGIIKDEYRLYFSILYGFVASLSFILAILVDNKCSINTLGLLLFIPALCSWSCCGYHCNLTKCE